MRLQNRNVIVVLSQLFYTKNHNYLEEIKNEWCLSSKLQCFTYSLLRKDKWWGHRLERCISGIPIYDIWRMSSCMSQILLDTEPLKEKVICDTSSEFSILNLSWWPRINSRRSLFIVSNEKVVKPCFPTISYILIHHHGKVIALCVVCPCCAGQLQPSQASEQVL